MTATTTKRQSGESRDEHLERWKREQPERLAAHREQRNTRSAPTRAFLQAKDFAVGVLALALVAALLLAALLLAGWFLWELIVGGWRWLFAILVVVFIGLAVESARGRF